MSTETMRRPWMRSAQNSSPSTRRHSPSTGTCPSALNTSPPTVSHSSCGQVDVEQLVDLVDRGAAGHAQRAVGQAFDAGLVDVVLVGDLADDLLEQVLHRDETGGAAVLVDDDRHVELLGLHLAQQLGDALRLGHEVRGPQRCRAPARCPRRSALRATRSFRNTSPTMSSVLSSYAGSRDLPGRDRDRDRLVDGRVGLDRDHVGARQHHLAHDRVAELEDRVDELALLGLDRRLLGGDVGHREDLLLGDERAPPQSLARQHDVGETDEAARRARATAGSA